MASIIRPESYGYQLVPRSLFLERAPGNLQARAADQSIGEGGYSWIIWDPQDDEDGYMVTGQSHSALLAEFQSFAAAFEDEEESHKDSHIWDESRPYSVPEISVWMDESQYMRASDLIGHAALLADDGTDCTSADPEYMRGMAELIMMAMGWSGDQIDEIVDAIRNTAIDQRNSQTEKTTCT